MLKKNKKQERHITQIKIYTTCRIVIVNVSRTSLSVTSKADMKTTRHALLVVSVKNWLLERVPRDGREEKQKRKSRIKDIIRNADYCRLFSVCLKCRKILCIDMDKNMNDMEPNPRETANIFSVLFFWFVKIFNIYIFYLKKKRREERIKCFCFLQ